MTNNNQNITELLKTLLENPTKNRVQVTITKSNGEVITLKGSDLIGTLFTDIENDQTEVTQIIVGNLTPTKALHAAATISKALQKTK